MLKKSFFLAVLPLLSLISTLTASDAHLLMAGAGPYDIFRWSKGKTNFKPFWFLEARPLWILFNHKNKVLIRPMAGWLSPNLDANYIYAGVAFDLFVSDRVVLTPSFAPGYWFNDSRNDLGYPLEFRTSLELAYRFTSKARLGLIFSHISNAHLGTNNPGADMAGVFVSIPFDLSGKN